MTDEIYLKNSLTVNNSIITLGDTDDSGKGRHFKSRFIQPGLAGYPGQYGNALIKKENLDKFVYTLRNKPVIINHKDEIEEKDKVGEVFNVWFNPDDGWYWCDGIITDVTAQNLIKDKGWSVSCSYNFTSYNDDGGTENNVPYDIEFLDGEFMHLAIVDKPRYEGANIVMNAKDKDNEGEWITVKGNHILVKEGQTKEEAVKSFIEKQQGKIEPTQPSEPAKNPPQRKEQNPEPGKKKSDPDEFERIYRKKIEKQHNDATKALDELANIFIKEDDSRISDKNIKKRYYKDALDNKHIKDMSLTIEGYGYWEREYNPYKNRNIYKQPEGWSQDVKSKIAQFKRDYPKFADKIEYSTSSENPDINIHLYWRDDDKAEKETKKKLEKINNNLTEKEITMSVLNELESFVKGVIRNANDEDEKEVKNEKVDKRELIEEVGGMLKGKVDDEIIRTIIKKMEEASYDESEAGSADNKKVKNESENEKEDKKAENKKVKNEESEDDKEKVEELKKDEKEDVENKCNNSKTDFYDKMNKIYNSPLTPSKSETEYTSRADRLKAGEEYFKV